MKLQELYELETGEKALYRMKDKSSDYHTSKYVEWLEEKVRMKIEKVSKFEWFLIFMSGFIFGFFFPIVFLN